MRASVALLTCAVLLYWAGLFASLPRRIGFNLPCLLLAGLLAGLSKGVTGTAVERKSNAITRVLSIRAIRAIRVILPFPSFLLTRCNARTAHGKPGQQAVCRVEWSAA